MLEDALLRNCAAIAIATAHAKMTTVVVTLALAPALNRESFARASRDCQMHVKLVKEIVNAKTTIHSAICTSYLAW